MRSWWIILGVLLGPGVQAQTLLPDKDTVIRIGKDRKGFGFLRTGDGVFVHPADALADGRVPVVVLVLIPADRKRHAWEDEIELLEKKIAVLEAEKENAYGDHEYQLAKMIEEAKNEIQSIQDRVGARGKKTDLAVYKAAELGVLLLKKSKGEWQIVEAQKLGSYGRNELGAPPEDAHLEVRVQDTNKNGFAELKLTAFIDLYTPHIRDQVARNHSYHFLIEFFPQGTRTTYQIDGGVDSGGMCEGVLDGMTTAKFWIKTPKRGPAELTVSRARSMCEQENDPLRNLPAFQRLSWSDIYRRWQVFKGHKPDSFLIVAASSPDKKKLGKTLKRLKRRRLQRRFRLGKSFPRMVMSDDFRGLMTGSYLLVLGACPDAGRAKTVMRQIRKKYRGKGLSYSVRGYVRKPGSKLFGVCPKAR